MMGCWGGGGGGGFVPFWCKKHFSQIVTALQRLFHLLVQYYHVQSLCKLSFVAVALIIQVSKQFTRLHAHVDAHAHTHTHTCTCTHARTHTHTNTHTHIHTHTHTQLNYSVVDGVAVVDVAMVLLCCR